MGTSDKSITFKYIASSHSYTIHTILLCSLCLLLVTAYTYVVTCMLAFNDILIFQDSVIYT